MKRAAVFGIVVAVIATTWTLLVAQTSPVRVNSPMPAQAAPEPIRPVPIVDPTAAPLGQVPAQSPLTPLQQRFVELSTKKARLMTEEQLQQAVNALDRDVEGLNAWSKIEDSARQLREIVEKHPQTRAAKAAESALKIIEENRSNLSPSAGDKFETPSPNVSPFGADSERTAPGPHDPKF
jgi:hypothetical protein